MSVLQAQAIQAQSLGGSDDIIAAVQVGSNDADPLLHRITDLEHDVPIAVQGNRMPNGTAEKLNRDLVIGIISIQLQGKVVAILLRSVPGESGITGNLLQRAINADIAYTDAILKITYLFTEQFRITIFRGDSDAYEGFAISSSAIALQGRSREPDRRVSSRLISWLKFRSKSVKWLSSPPLVEPTV